MLIVGLALLVATDNVQTPPAAAPTTAPRTRVRRICRLEERLGTILPHRVCRTEAEWATFDQEAGKVYERQNDFVRDHYRTEAIDRKPQS